MSASDALGSGPRLTGARQGARALRRVAVFFGMMALVLYALNPVWMQALGFSLPLWLRWAGFATGLLSLGPLAWTETALGRQ